MTEAEIAELVNALIGDRWESECVNFGAIIRARFGPEAMAKKKEEDDGRAKRTGADAGRE